MNLKKGSFSKPTLTPFRQSPPIQQGSWKFSIQRGKHKQTNVGLKRLPERRQRKTERRQSTVVIMELETFQVSIDILCSIVWTSTNQTRCYSFFYRSGHRGAERNAAGWQEVDRSARQCRGQECCGYERGSSAVTGTHSISFLKSGFLLSWHICMLHIRLFRFAFRITSLQL